MVPVYFAVVFGLFGYGLGKRIEESEKNSLTNGTKNEISKENANEPDKPAKIEPPEEPAHMEEIQS